jgi:hypothetical protein
MPLLDLAGSVKEMQNEEAPYNNREGPDWDAYYRRKDVPTFRCWRIHPAAQLPTRAHNTDVGWDIYTVETVLFEVKQYLPLHTGLVIQPPDGHYFELVPRSSTFRKFGLMLALPHNASLPNISRACPRITGRR